MKAKIIRLDIQESRESKPRHERYSDIWEAIARAIARAIALKAIAGTTVRIVIDPPRKPALAGMTAA